MTFRTRFAPSPTGPLHLGHAYSAITAHDMARSENGVFLLRIDDIDRDRSKPEWEQGIFDDLAWLGLSWPEPVMREAAAPERFNEVLHRLAALDLLYPCSCSRSDIEAAASAPQEGAPTHGPDGRIYPGTCRGRPMSDYRPGDAMRLDMKRALARAEPLPFFAETGPQYAGSHHLNTDMMLGAVGDIVVSRKTGDIAYHIAVVVDDHVQNITHVIRGEDLFGATVVHVLLQRLLGYQTPTYHHHTLIRDENGKRLAKRDDARAISAYRAAGATPEDIRRMVGL